ncbi:MAG: hypothetical protein AAF958_02895 [Planctomycetota bacterium]
MSPLSGPAGEVMAVKQASEAQKTQVALMKKQLDAVKSTGDAMNQLVANAARIADGQNTAGPGRFDARG